MAHDQDLSGKTFEQQVQVAGKDIATRDISPNRRVPGEIVFEPLGTGVRVTARDAEHRVLWGYVGAKETVKQIHCLVAIYDTLQDLLAEELKKSGLFRRETGDPMTTAQAALDRLENTVKWLRDSLDVKKVSDATADRARTIARIASDANRQITLEAETLKGMKSKSEPGAGTRR
ncbi:MAG: hypothetical protein A2Z31_06675 [candidate division NC10 bacterium RBG_16_65_8]|nr:MAG: hypothetical protein A2Z31_06675 [candidate division NC10 bacterium RBG_16_65_8]